MELIAASRRGELVRVARLEGDDLREFYLWDLQNPDGVGDNYSGRVDAVMPELAGRFVDLGGASGFLPDSAGGKATTIGDYISVTVTRAAQNDKGPRLATVTDAPGNKPGLQHRGPGPLLELAERFASTPIIADDYELIAMLRPALADRLSYKAAAFDAVLEDEIAGLGEPSIALPFGAMLHITPAPAATLLDVDAGAGSTMNVLSLNIGIIPEICRQITLRNLSGGILIDFAGMKPRARETLKPALLKTLRADYLRPEFLGFSHLGFAELTRRRIRPPLHEIFRS